MQQRVYRGDVTAGELADYLIQHYDPQKNRQAQKLGEGNALMVQIGDGDDPGKMNHAVTVAITHAPGAAPGLTVTMGQQQWLSPSLAGYTAMMGLIALLVTPWVLFALIWPISEMIRNSGLPDDIWNTVDLYLASRGGTPDTQEMLQHPHAV